jgi:hypothetical protein
LTLLNFACIRHCCDLHYFRLKFAPGIAMFAAVIIHEIPQVSDVSL